MRKLYKISLAKKDLVLGERTLIMGILNVTPDSFSDGGRFAGKDAAVAHALKMVKEGVDIIDIGGESTRPGAEAVSIDEELRRVLPIIEAIKKETDVPISIDTYKSQIAAAALDAGADIINDISGCSFDPSMPALAAKRNAPIIAMHIKGTPKNMQKDPEYKDVMQEIKNYLAGSIQLLVKAGLPREQVIIDPGFGFGKTPAHTLAIMNRLDEFSELDRPLLAGVSRKSVIGHVLNLPVQERIFGTAAAVAANIMKGAHVIRVHEIAQMRQVAEMIDAIVGAASACPP